MFLWSVLCLVFVRVAVFVVGSSWERNPAAAGKQIDRPGGLIFRANSASSAERTAWNSEQEFCDRRRNRDDVEVSQVRQARVFR